MSAELAIAVFMSSVAAATPLLLAGLGELVVERSGVLNLGVEGMMLIGAIAGFATAVSTNQPGLGVLAAALSGIAAALLFGLLTQQFAANQVATGLAMTIFGIGASALAGAPYVGVTTETVGNLFPAALADHAVARLVFGHGVLTYVALAAAAAIGWFLMRTRGGLILRAVGESAESAHAIGYRVIAIRLRAIAFGGMMAGIAGAAFSLYLTPLWAEGMTAGRGWIAVALVVFAAWRVDRLVIGAALFGAVVTLELHAKAAGVAIPSQFLAMAPYLATIVVLTLISIRARRFGGGAPADLTKPFRPTR
ncbi:MAG: ABC transporter permease [Pseudomonadota bacterium]